MIEFKKTKWVDYKFSKEQKKARSIQKRAHEYEMDLSEALLTSPDSHDRQYFHDRLDYLLDNIESMRKAAFEIFPEVDESSAIATLEI